MFKVKPVIVLGLVFLLSGSGILHSQSPSLIPFNVRPGTNRSVVVQWTAKEKADSFQYEVERSCDMRTWETIAHLSPQMSHTYSGIDLNPVEGMNYYRIRQIARNDQFLTRSKMDTTRPGRKIIFFGQALPVTCCMSSVRLLRVS